VSESEKNEKLRQHRKRFLFRIRAATTNAEEIPSWVPAAVKKLAVQFGFAEELVRHLLTDPKMKNVWQYLLRRAQPVDSEIADSKAALEFCARPRRASVRGLF
jgi:hypothetical protein